MAAAAASAITEGGLPPLRFRGCAYFRLRVVLATLSGRRIRIDGIREKDEEPGVKGASRPRPAPSVRPPAESGGSA